jgi:hypothetical protein
MLSGNETKFRGLNPSMPLVLAEGGKKYSLKRKRRTNIYPKALEMQLGGKYARPHGHRCTM